MPRTNLRVGAKICTISEGSGNTYFRSEKTRFFISNRSDKIHSDRRKMITGNQSKWDLEFAIISPIVQLFYPPILILQWQVNSKSFYTAWQVVLGSNCHHFLWSVRTGMQLQLYMKFWKFQFFSFFTLILILQRKMNSKRLNKTWEVVLGSKSCHLLTFS